MHMRIFKLKNQKNRTFLLGVYAGQGFGPAAYDVGLTHFVQPNEMQLSAMAGVDPCPVIARLGCEMIWFFINGTTEDDYPTLKLPTGVVTRQNTLYLYSV